MSKMTFEEYQQMVVSRNFLYRRLSGADAVRCVFKQVGSARPL